MRIYWRIMGDLMELGEMLLFHDPSLLREYGKWCKRNGISCLGTFKVDPFMVNDSMDKLVRKEVTYNHRSPWLN